MTAHDTTVDVAGLPNSAQTMVTRLVDTLRAPVFIPGQEREAAPPCGRTYSLEEILYRIERRLRLVHLVVTQINHGQPDAKADLSAGCEELLEETIAMLPDLNGAPPAVLGWGPGMSQEEWEESIDA